MSESGVAVCNLHLGAQIYPADGPRPDEEKPTIVHERTVNVLYNNGKYLCSV